jgi:hypothetical protein
MVEQGNLTSLVQHFYMIDRQLFRCRGAFQCWIEGGIDIGKTACL